MGIYNNGYRLGNNPFKYRCGALTTIYNPTTMLVGQSNAGWKRGIQYNTGTLTALPQGSNTPGTWMLPQKAGGMSSHSEAQGTSIASLLMAKGWNIEGLAEGTTPTVEATMQLVVSMVATALGEATTNANLNAALGLSGSTTGEATNNAIITALAWAIGQANGEATATLVRYATGELKGSITPFTELSPEGLAAAVWNSLASQYNEDGTMGELLNSAGAAADPLLGVVEGALTLRDVQRIVLAVLAGQVTGAGSGTETFKGQGGEDRVVSTVDNDGNRSSVTLDAS